MSNTVQYLTHTRQLGKAGACYLAQIFDADGKSVATIDATQIPEQATERARRLAACWNACIGIDIELLEQSPELFNNLLAALRAYESAWEEMFAQCCSNPITDAWGRQLNMTKFNTAHQLAGRALRTPEQQRGLLMALKGGGE